MKRIHLWSLLGISGTGLAAVLLGQAVSGQPYSKVPLPVPPITVPEPELPGEGAKDVDGPVPTEGVSGQLPHFPPMPAANKPPLPIKPVGYQEVSKEATVTVQSSPA